MANYKLHAVATYPNRTLVSFDNADEKEGAEYFVFGDMHNNGKLDKGDKRYAVYTHGVRTGICHPANSFDSMGEYECLNEVSDADISQFGSQTDEVIRLAREHRQEMKKNLPTTVFTRQTCLQKEFGTNCVQKQVVFDPPLSMSTRWSSGSADNCDTLSFSDTFPMEQVRVEDCLEAEAEFTTLWRGVKIPATFSVGEYSAVLGYFDIEGKFGAIDATDIPDIQIQAGFMRGSETPPYYVGHADISE